MTQQELAKACGVRFQQIQKYECGANAMSAGRLWQVASATNTPIAYFFEGLSAQRGGREQDTSAETQDLIRSFADLHDEQRRRFLQLVRAMNPSDDPSDRD